MRVLRLNLKLSAQKNRRVQRRLFIGAVRITLFTGPDNYYQLLGVPAVQTRPRTICSTLIDCYSETIMLMEHYVPDEYDSTPP